MAIDRAELDRLVDRVSAFVRDRVIPLERDPEAGGHGPSDRLARELRALARDAGLLCPQLGEAWGGMGLTMRQTSRVFRAAGYSPLGPVAMHVMAPDEGNMHLLAKVANPAQQEAYLAPLAAGDTRSAFLMTEPAEGNGAGSDPSMLRTTAMRDGEGWRLTGRKTFVTGGAGAAFGIVMAATTDGATMFLMPMDAPGVTIEQRIDSIDSATTEGHARIRLDDVSLPDDAVLGKVDAGFHYAQVRLAPARLTHCMRWLGGADRAQDIAVDYACRRRAFGKPLIDHEGVGFQLADNQIELRQAELMIDWCADILDGGETGIEESSMAKVTVSEGLYSVLDRCVQVMGATGVSGATIVEQLFREMRAFRIYDGPSEVHRWSLAKRIKRRGMAGMQAT